MQQRPAGAEAGAVVEPALKQRHSLFKCCCFLHNPPQHDIGRQAHGGIVIGVAGISRDRYALFIEAEANISPARRVHGHIAVAAVRLPVDDDRAVSVVLCASVLWQRKVPAGDVTANPVQPENLILAGKSG